MVGKKNGIEKAVDRWHASPAGEASLGVVEDGIWVRGDDAHDAELRDAEKEALFSFEKGYGSDGTGKDGGKVIGLLYIYQ